MSSFWDRKSMTDIWDLWGESLPSKRKVEKSSFIGSTTGVTGQHWRGGSRRHIGWVEGDWKGWQEMVPWTKPGTRGGRHRTTWKSEVSWWDLTGLLFKPILKPALQEGCSLTTVHTSPLNVLNSTTKSLGLGTVCMFTDKCGSRETFASRRRRSLRTLSTKIPMGYFPSTVGAAFSRVSQGSGGTRKWSPF